MAKPNFRVDIDPAWYQTIRDPETTEGGLIAKFASKDPRIRFIDNPPAVEVDDLDYRDLKSQQAAFCQIVGMKAYPDVMENFATKAYIAELQNSLNKARNDLRDTFDDDDYEDVDEPDIDPNASDKQAGAAILKDAKGMVLGYDHKDQGSKDYIADMISDTPDLNLVFIEEFDQSLQPFIDQFLDDPTATSLPPEVQKRIEELKTYFLVDFEPILWTMKKRGGRIYGIDSNEDASPGVEKNVDPRYDVRRMMKMNAVANDIIKKALEKHKNDNPKPKFLVGTGEAHVNCFEGGVPGLSQLLGVPGVTRNPKSGKIRFEPDDESKRGMPSELEQKFIDDFMGEMLKKPLPSGAKINAFEANRVARDVADKLLKGGKLKPGVKFETLFKDQVAVAAMTDIVDRTSKRPQRRADLKTAIKENKVADAKRLLGEDKFLAQEADELTEATLLHEACGLGHADIVDELIKAGANVNARDLDRNTPFHKACLANPDAANQGNFTQVVKKLLAGKAKTDLPNENGQTVYNLAKDKNNPEMLDELVAAGLGGNSAVIDQYVVRYVAEAEKVLLAKKNPNAIVKLEPREVREKGRRRALAHQIEGDLKVAGDIDGLMKSTKTKIGGEVYLKLPAELDKLVDVTIARGPRKDELLQAIKKGERDKVQQLAAQDPYLVHIEHEENTPLGRAANLGQKEIVEDLLKLGADVNQKNSRGMTALHEICRSEVPKVDIPPKNQGEPSAHEGVANIMEVLIKAGVDLNVQDKSGETALHWAAYRNNPKAIAKLKDADANIRSKAGWTAHDKALGGTNKEAEEQLVKQNQGSNKSAVPNGRKSTVEILVSATLCEDRRSDELKVRRMFEKLYGTPELRPILDLAAHAACNDRNPPNGGLRIFASHGFTVGGLFDKSPGPSGAYDEKVNTLLAPTMEHKDEKSPEGTIIHELTHLAAHLVEPGNDALPFKDAEEEKEYLEAIREDVSRLSRLVEEDPNQKFVMNRLGSRMVQYSNKPTQKENDHAYMQEFIVGIPQLASLYGMDWVKEHAPNLCKYFEDFTKKCETVAKTDDRFARGRKVVSPRQNTKLAKELEKRGVGAKSPEPVFLPKDTDALNIDKIMEKLTAECSRPYSAPNVKVPWKSDDFSLVNANDQVAIDKKMAKVKSVLKKVLTPDKFPDEVSGDLIRKLTLDIDKAVRGAPNDKAMLQQISIAADTWTKKARIEFVKNRIAKEKPVTNEQLAETIILESEFRAMDPVATEEERFEKTLEVNKSKQKDVISNLAKDLGKPEFKSKVKKPGELVESLSTELADETNAAIRQKMNKEGTDFKNPQHVSIDKKVSRRVWLDKLAEKTF